MGIRIGIGGLKIGGSSGSTVVGVQYYVSNAGNDALDGLSPINAWRTIAKVNATSFVPGDKIGFKKGDVWRETLIVPSDNIQFGAYGSGANPIIDGTEIITDWSADEESGGLFLSGLETEIDAFTTEWTKKETANGNTVTLATAVINHGDKSMAVTWAGTGTGANVYKDLSNQTHINYRFYFFLPTAFEVSQNATMFDLAGIYDTDWGGLINLLLCSDALSKTQFHLRLNLTHPGNTFVYTGQDNSISTNAWHYVEMVYVKSATVGGWELKLDGISLGSNYTLNTNTYNPNRVYCGDGGWGGGVGYPIAGKIVYFDDIKVSTSSIGAYGAVSGVYNATVALITPNLVYKNNLFQTKGSSKVALNNGEWFFASGVLSYRNDAGSPTGITATLRNYALTTNGKANIVLRPELVVGYGNYKRFQDNFLEDVLPSLSAGGYAEPTALVSNDGLRLDLWCSYNYYAYSLDGLKFSDPVLITPHNVSCGHMMKVGNEYWYYAGLSQASIHLYIGTDRINFVDQGVVIAKGGIGEWDYTALGNMFIWKEDNNWFMLYEANGVATGWAIGLAISLDGKSWIKYGSNPVIPGDAGNPEMPRVNNEVIKYNENYYVYYHSQLGTVNSIKRAYSSDLHTWTQEGGILNNRAIHGAPYITFADQAMVQFKGKSYMFWTPSSQAGVCHIDCGIDNRPLAEMLALTP